jgi:hypothetical protein
VEQGFVWSWAVLGPNFALARKKSIVFDLAVIEHGTGLASLEDTVDEF